MQRVPKNNLFRIVRNSLIANPDIAEGRMIPVLLLESKDKEKLNEALKINKNSGTGDLDFRWLWPLSKITTPKYWYLEIELIQPSKYTFSIEFNLKKDYPLISAILKSRGIYINTFKKEEIGKLEKFDNSLLIEIPDTGIDQMWSKTQNKILRKQFIREKVSKKEIKTEIRKHLKKMDEILSVRSMKNQ